MMGKITLRALLSLALVATASPILAQEGGSAPRATQALEGRWYLAPMGTFTLTDGDRNTDDGFGGTVALGRMVTDEIAVEVSGQYSRLDPASLYTVGASALLFPTRYAVYGLIGAGYLHANNHPGVDPDYGAFTADVGLGYLWGKYEILGHDLFVRTEAMYRLDAHSTTRTGTSLGNGRRSFNDAVVNVGVLIPIGAGAPPPAPPPPAPVPEVVPVEAPPPAPPPPPPPPCRSPGAGEKVDLSGCGTGDVIVLHGVNFEFNKATLTLNAKTILDQVVDALKAVPATRIEVGGYTDGKGSAPYNLKLSQRRADAVKTYLVAHGIDAARMTTQGYGMTHPIADNATDEGREQNRRVELKILEAAAPAAATPAPAAQ